MFLQLPSPVPSPVQPNPTIPGGGSYPYGGSGGAGSWANPSNYTGLAHELGPAWFILLIFTILLFLACGYMIWRSWKQPSNAQQVTILRWMYKDAQKRNARLRRVLGSFCDIVCVFSKSGQLASEEKAKIEATIQRVRDSLESEPPPTPDLLKLDDDDEENL